ncbi:hypothetical protein MPH_09925 [Macrophomina phaseolina MS6]|uniref:Uncharacterized protein n=1 Tax=Macrophomina phaseolina (strain MS6) TaxID=1126212 RepID=K2REC2_MACPH|nr:hypothetical protein MPH_09925 [Macrophomina phaseolina MS6]
MGCVATRLVRAEDTYPSADERKASSRQLNGPEAHSGRGSSALSQRGHKHHAHAGPRATQTRSKNIVARARVQEYKQPSLHCPVFTTSPNGAPVLFSNSSSSLTSAWPVEAMKKVKEDLDCSSRQPEVVQYRRHFAPGR